jgi:hypothetical protein
VFIDIFVHFAAVDIGTTSCTINTHTNLKQSTAQ